MHGFNYRESTSTDCCDTCYKSRYHLYRGLLCWYTDENVKPRNICGLYIAHGKPEEVEEKQGELF